MEGLLQQDVELVHLILKILKKQDLVTRDVIEFTVDPHLLRSI